MYLKVSVSLTMEVKATKRDWSNNSKENWHLNFNDGNQGREVANVMIHITNYDEISD